MTFRILPLLLLPGLAVSAAAPAPELISPQVKTCVDKAAKLGLRGSHALLKFATEHKSEI